jgi:hypothetical protein
MATNPRISLIASAAFVLVTFVIAADAQPYGPGSGMRGQGWGPGMMMGPGIMGRGDFGRMCSPAAVGFAEWRIDRLEQVIKPTDTQRAKFDEYKAASSKAADAMRNACPTDLPTTAVGRMEAMEKRMDAMLQAVRTVRPALEAFYATLSDEQRARLNSNAGPGRHWRWRDQQ